MSELSVYLLQFLTILFFLLISAFFSASESALFSLSQTKIRTYAKSSEEKKRLVAELVFHSRDLLVTIFMLNTLSNILLQNVASAMFGPEASFTQKVVLPLVVTLVFAEIIPKYLGMINNEKFSLLIAPAINAIQDYLKPVRQLTVAVTAPVSRWIFFFLKPEESISADELRHTLQSSEKGGILEKDEAELIYGYLNLQEASVKEIMWPREDIAFYDIQEPLSKLVHLFVDRKFSRLPVCNGNLDTLLGIVDAEDFFLHKDEIKDAQDLKKILEKPFYTPETTDAKALLSSFKQEGQNLALAVDEYGSMTGIISKEDLLETVIGSIESAKDEPELYSLTNKNEIIASGKIDITEFNQVFNTDLKSKYNMVTLGGYLIETLGEIPKSGYKFEKENLFFHILSADPNRIRRVYVRKVKSGQS